MKSFHDDAHVSLPHYQILLYPGTWYFYRRINKRREIKWNSMSAEERNDYLSTTTDKGNGRLDFRFAN